MPQLLPAKVDAAPPGAPLKVSRARTIGVTFDPRTRCWLYPDAIPHQLKCAICNEVCAKPVQTPCDHLYCEDHLLEWFARSKDNCRCPLDNENISPKNVHRAWLVALFFYAAHHLSQDLRFFRL
jgi:hypothetical protein